VSAASSGGPPAGSAPEVVAVAFCPGPPLLLPAVEGRPAEETAALRAACDAAVREVLAAAPDTVVVLGPVQGRYGSGDVGDLRGFGVPLEIPLAAGDRGRRLPLPLTVGAWLLDRARHHGPRVGVGPEGLAAVLAGLPGRTALLAMGDGSARRSLKAPGYLDPAAEPFDAAVAVALQIGDTQALADLDETEGERLLASGVPVWRAVGRALAGRRVTACLWYDDAPYGVGYLVADWRLR
jgi:hypothetical protein